MKNLIEQFYNEGFATTFYKKPVKYINKKIKNKTLVKILSILIKVLYTVIFTAIAIYYLIK
ncbi:MAG: hypothetical protein ACI33S_06310 [Bacilli bacterium]